MLLRTFFIFTIATNVLGNQQVGSVPKICETAKCVEEAENILNYVDPNANPCEDFYQFACGTFVKNAAGNEDLELIPRTLDEQHRILLGMYQEGINENDHKMVKVAKNLYQQCMKEDEIVDDFKFTIKEILSEVGGWPVLEGSSWNEAHFDWLNATYALRKLGYDYSAFLNLGVEMDLSEYETVFLLQVDGGKDRFSSIDPKEDIAKVAVFLGAESEETAVKDLNETYNFAKNLGTLRFNVSPTYTKRTVEDIQKTEGIINWMEFINNIAGPKVSITKHDYVLFPTDQYITQVLDLISKTPKRTQANYFMWKVIKPLLEYIPNCEVDSDLCNGGKNKWSKFCLETTHSRLITGVVSPMDVIRLRRYLSEERRNKIEELVLNIKSEFLQSVSKIEWIFDEKKQQFIDKVKKATVVVGTAGKYSDDTILDVADVDMTSNKNDNSFFRILAQVNRNLKSAEYNAVVRGYPEKIYATNYIAKIVVPKYDFVANDLLYVPIISKFLYDENRPEYVNYGRLGTIVAFELTKRLFERMDIVSYVSGPLGDCIEPKDHVSSEMRRKQNYLMKSALISAEKIAHAAYEEWKNKNNEEIFFVVTIATYLLGNQQVGSVPKICDTAKCVQEAENILNYVDPNANPCEDFYQFACGTFVKNAAGNEDRELIPRTLDEQHRILLGMYQEGINENDHKMVKVAKNLYQQCMKEDEIKDDFRVTIKEILREVGGWPVLEGSSWNEAHFDWLNATYALRKLGYEYSAFLNLGVEMEWNVHVRKIEFLLHVDGGEHRFSRIDPKEDIAKVAAFLGAESEETAAKDLTEAYDFTNQLIELRYKVNPIYIKRTVEHIQKTEGIINWMEFINKIAGPKVSITKDDYVLFPTEQYLTQVLDLISKTPKRTQANYFMWKVIKPLLEYIPNCEVDSDLCNGGKNKRSKYCMETTHSRLATGVLSPMDVIRLRRYLSEERRNKIEELVLNIKSEFLQSVIKIEWILEWRKEKFIEKVKKATVVVGTEGNYSDDTILDEADVDMTSNQYDNSFFRILAQVNRNLKSAEYNAVVRGYPEIIYAAYDIADVAIPKYDFVANDLLYVPIISKFLYDENRPEYVNYGRLGTIVALQLTKRLFMEMNSVSYVSGPLGDCIEPGDHFSGEMREKQNYLMKAALISAEEIAHAAYEEWKKNNSEEYGFDSINYTPKRLFWISAASILCQPLDTPEDLTDYFLGLQVTTKEGAYESFRHSSNLSQDFNCPVNSKMNPSKKCKTL